MTFISENRNGSDGERLFGLFLLALAAAWATFGGR